MRHTSPNRRGRKRSNGRQSGQSRTHVYDSNGPDVRIRGTAHQVAEKYQALAKDAKAAGDHIVAENYYQHAEHYVRIINSLKPKHQPESKDSSGDEHQKQNTSNRDEELSLPDSILGSKVEVSSEEAVAV